LSGVRSLGKGWLRTIGGHMTDQTAELIGSPHDAPDLSAHPLDFPEPFIWQTG